MALLGNNDWASTTCFDFSDETDEITEIMVTARGEYVIALELKAEVFQTLLQTSPQAQAAVEEFLDSWRKGRAKRNEFDKELTQAQKRAIRKWEQIMMPIKKIVRHSRPNGPKLSLNNLKVLHVDRNSEDRNAKRERLLKEERLVDEQDTDKGSFFHVSSVQNAALPASPGDAIANSTHAPDYHELTDVLVRSNAVAYETTMKRMEASISSLVASISSLVAVQAKHSQALARIELDIEGLVSKPGHDRPAFSAASASMSAASASMSGKASDSKGKVQSADPMQSAQLVKVIDESVVQAISGENTVTSRPFTSGSDVESFLGLLPGLMRQGAIETIIRGMNAHTQNAVVQERACNVLFMLAESADNQVQIARAGGIESVRAAMAVHLKIAWVQEQGCGALRNLAVDPDNQLKIAGDGGLEGVVAAMAEHVKDERVQEQACGALQNLAVNVDNKAKIAREGGIELVVAAMSAHPKAARVQEQACGTLSNLAGNVENQSRIATAGGIERVISAMAVHPQALGLQQRACAALWALAVNKENQAKILKAGGTDHILASMAAHPSPEGFQLKACETLNNLGIDTPPVLPRGRSIQFSFEQLIPSSSSDRVRPLGHYVTYMIHLLQMLEESIKVVSPCADRVE